MGRTSQQRCSMLKMMLGSVRFLRINPCQNTNRSVCKCDVRWHILQVYEAKRCSTSEINQLHGAVACVCTVGALRLPFERDNVLRGTYCGVCGWSLLCCF